MKTDTAPVRFSVILALAPSLLQLSAQTAHLGGPKAVPDMYRITRDQAGHEWVKREQFVVSMSESFGIRELESIPGSAVITRADGRVVQQIFNSVEEMSENTISDPDPARVAEFKKMEFAVRGYAGDSPKGEKDAALGERRAKALVDFLTNLGTPPWRLHVQAMDREPTSGDKGRAECQKAPAAVEFVRIK